MDRPQVECQHFSQAYWDIWYEPCVLALCGCSIEKDLPELFILSEFGLCMLGIIGSATIPPAIPTAIVFPIVSVVVLAVP